MARARNIKPSFFTDDKLADIPLAGRLLFAGLWCLADRSGRLEDRPRRIKVELLPYDDVNVDELLDRLHEHGFIHRYQVTGDCYIQIVNFERHQNPHVKETESTIPAPDSPGASTVPVPSKPSCGRADSGFLIPDSGFPSTPLSGSQASADVLVLPTKHPRVNGEAAEILGFLNAKTGRHFRGDNALKPIKARLREGFTSRECRAVIARKVRDWNGDDKMRMYLRPATLFGAEKFAQYVGEVPPEEPADAA